MPATLSSLRIRNLALVEELEWRIAPGFTAVTGETGSGKSIIIGALKLLLGERAEKSLIRSGELQCTVEGVFDLGDTTALDRELEEQGLEPCSDGQLILKRVFTAAGANRQFINCSATTLAVLKMIAEPLVDLHGPHDHQSLLSNERQLELLDGFAGAAGAAGEYRALFARWKSLERERDDLAGSEAAVEREIDLLRHQAREIELAELREEEEASLLSRYAVASNGRRLLELATQVEQRLVEAEDAVLPRLAETQRLARELERIDPAAAEFAAANERAVVELEELVRSLQAYAGRLDLDPAQVAALEQRVTLLETLKRKYGPQISDVIAFGANAAERLRRIESRGEELERLAGEIEAARSEAMKAGAALSKKRVKAAPRLAAEVKAQLQDLGFKQSDFEVSLNRLPAAAAHGLEGVEFLICPNPGEPLKPLKAIASSGEISRLMLAVKSALAAQDTVSLMVFDEIDANVGGEIAHAVGAKMRALGERHQVIAITHLPQVAAQAGEQFVVEKQYRDGRTVSTLAALARGERADEIARMLGGQGKSALAHAKTLLQEVR